LALTREIYKTNLILHRSEAPDDPIHIKKTAYTPRRNPE
jgi:hypothetical protein